MSSFLIGGLRRGDIKDRPVDMTPIGSSDDTSDVGLIEWTVGDRWTWDINFRCSKCDMVKPLNAFSKKQQTYGFTSRTCKQCW